MVQELENKSAVAIFIGVTKLFKALNSNNTTLKLKNIFIKPITKIFFIQIT